MAVYGAQFQKNKKKVAEINLQTHGDYTCEMCGKTPLFKGNGTTADALIVYNNALLTIDHIVPISKGGKNGLYNLKVCCNKCNSDKGCQ